MNSCNFSPADWVLRQVKDICPPVPPNPWRGRIAWWLSLLLLGSGRGGAETAPSTEKAGTEARQIVARYVTASGGESAIRKQTSRLSEGKFESATTGVSGSLEMLQASPRKTFQKLVLDNSLTLTMGADGRSGWVSIPGFGVQEMESRLGQQFMEDTDLMAPVELAARLTNQVVRPSATVEGVACDVIAGTNAQGKMETLYFSRDSGLLVRWDRSKLTSTGDWAASETFYGDYREVDGLKLPFRIAGKGAPDQTFSLTLSSIKLGVPAPDDRFKKPDQ